MCELCLHCGQEIEEEEERDFQLPDKDSPYYLPVLREIKKQFDVSVKFMEFAKGVDDETKPATEMKFRRRMPLERA